MKKILLLLIAFYTHQSISFETALIPLEQNLFTLFFDMPVPDIRSEVFVIPPTIKSVLNIKDSGVYSDRNKRSYQEDRFGYSFNPSQKCAVFGVFDGHGGPRVAQFSAQNLPKKLAENTLPLTAEKNLQQKMFFTPFDRAITENMLFDQQGSTAIIVKICPNNTALYNIGDSRALIIKNDTTIISTIDHKPTNPTEEKRINNEIIALEKIKNITIGGVLKSEPTKITLSTLSFNNTRNTFEETITQYSVSRGLGDTLYLTDKTRNKAPGIYHIPDITIETTNTIYAIILACDGIWDVLDNKEVTNILLQNTTLSAEKLAEKIVSEAKKSGSNDNLTTLVILFNTTASIQPQTTSTSSTKKTLFGVYQIENIKTPKTQLEDRYNTLISENCSLFAVYDGHAGVDTVEYVNTHLLTNLNQAICNNVKFTKSEVRNKHKDHLISAKSRRYQIIAEEFEKLDKKILTNPQLKNQGSLAIITLVRENHVYLINLGDSRGIIKLKSGKIFETIDHHTHSIINNKKTLNIDELAPLLLRKTSFENKEDRGTIHLQSELRGFGDQNEYMIYINDNNELKIAFYEPPKKAASKNISLGKADSLTTIKSLLNKIQTKIVEVTPYTNVRIGNVNMTRAFGDIYPKREGLIVNPDVFVFDRNEVEWIIIACDGVWDVLSSQDVATIVDKDLKNKTNLNDIAKNITTTARNKNSKDDITAMVIIP